jgi:hypothetical protein
MELGIISDSRVCLLFQKNALKSLWQVLKEREILSEAWGDNQEADLSADCGNYNYNEESGNK